MRELSMKEFDPRGYTADELRQIRTYITQLLGESVRTDVLDTLQEHLDTCIQVRDILVSNARENPSGVASALNAVTQAIDKIARIQVDLNGAEKVQRLTKIVVAALKDKPEAKELIEAMQKEYNEYQYK